jgi:hypothetical protein
MRRHWRLAVTLALITALLHFVSLFFDILLASRKGIDKKLFLNGFFKNEHNVSENQITLIRQARSFLWNTMQPFEIKNITIEPIFPQIYMDNLTFQHRAKLFCLPQIELNAEYKLIKNSFLIEDNSTFEPALNNLSTILNSIFKSTKIVHNSNAIILNSEFIDCQLNIGSNSYLSDISWVNY